MQLFKKGTQYLENLYAIRFQFYTKPLGFDRNNFLLEMVQKCVGT